MYNMPRESDLELGRFGEYLLKSRIVPEKYARYYVSWVRKFLAQIPERAGVTREDRIDIFIENLRPHVEAWQMDQAEKAIRLYFSNYLTDAGTGQSISELKPDATGGFRQADVLDAVRRLIRLRHYSYSTERTYLCWLQRFFRYLGSLNTPAQEGVFQVTPQGFSCVTRHCSRSCVLTAAPDVNGKPRQQKSQEIFDCGRFQSVSQRCIFLPSGRRRTGTAFQGCRIAALKGEVRT